MIFIYNTTADDLQVFNIEYDFSLFYILLYDYASKQ